MKTIKQIADEVGVSKQAIQQRIKKEPLATDLQPYISIIGGTKYIDIDGVNRIKSAYLKQETTNIADNISTKQPPSTDNELYTALLKTIEILQEQLKVKTDKPQLVKTQAGAIISVQEKHPIKKKKGFFSQFKKIRKNQGATNE